MRFKVKALIAAMAITLSTQQLAFADAGEMQELESYLKGVLGDNTQQVSTKTEETSKDGKSVKVVKYTETQKKNNNDVAQVVNTIKEEPIIKNAEPTTPLTDKQKEMKELEAEMKRIASGDNNNNKNPVASSGSNGDSAVVEVAGNILDKTPKDSDNSSIDSVFMKNLPEGTKFTAKQDFVVLPKRKFIIFSNGSRVIESPQVSNPLTTFCYVELNPSGRARILKEGKEIVIVKNETTESVYENPKEAWRGRIKVYQSKLFTDNASIKFFSCYSAYPEQKEVLPLTVKDFKVQTGDSFKIEFPAYEEI